MQKFQATVGPLVSSVGAHPLPAGGAGVRPCQHVQDEGPSTLLHTLPRVWQRGYVGQSHYLNSSNIRKVISPVGYSEGTINYLINIALVITINENLFVLLEANLHSTGVNDLPICKEGRVRDGR